VGNVWQWTDEFVDEHTRAAFSEAEATTSHRARSGISRRPTGTNQHGKLLLMAPSYGRSGTVGFRCVSDDE
jgi:iron(II)-dependent oxidoreductase